MAGVFILFSLHMTIVWDLANGNISISKHQSALIGGDGDSRSTTLPKARGPRPPSR